MHLTNPFTSPGCVVSSHPRAGKCHSLIDRGANGGAQGDDMRVADIAQPERHIDVTGVDDHETPKLRVGTAAGVATSQRGGVTPVSHRHALHGRGATTHSSSQLERHKNVVNDRPLGPGGAQSVTTNDGRTSPLDFQNGLPSLGLRPCTDEEWDTSPAVVVTEDMGRGPHHYDQGVSNERAWCDKQPDDSGQSRLFDQSGGHRRRSVADCGGQGPLPSPPRLDGPLSAVVSHQAALSHSCVFLLLLSLMTGPSSYSTARVRY